MDALQGRTNSATAVDEAVVVAQKEEEEQSSDHSPEALSKLYDAALDRSTLLRLDLVLVPLCVMLYVLCCGVYLLRCLRADQEAEQILLVLAR